MDADLPSPKNTPEFPVKPTKSQLRKLTAALLVDSLDAMGHGLPSSHLKRSALQSWFCRFTGEFIEQLEELFGREAGVRFERSFYVLPSIESAGTIDVVTLLAIRSRIRASVELGLDAASEVDAGTAPAKLWHVYKQAVFAHHRLQRQSRPELFGRAAEAAESILMQRWKLKGRLSWRFGLTASDVHAVVVSRLLGVDDIFGDFRAWVRMLKAGGLGDDWNSAIVDVDAARAAITHLTSERASERAQKVEQTLSELECLRDMEHEILEQSAIDPVCANLRIGTEVRFPLGPRGHLQLAPALPAISKALTEEDWGQLLAALEGDAVAPSAEQGAADHAMTERAAEDRQINVQSITAARCFLTWRGAPDSVAHARRELPMLLNSATRTAWLAMISQRGELEYFADPLWQESDPWERGAEIKPGLLGHRAFPVAQFPEEYPVLHWLQEVLGQALPESESRDEAFPIANSVRLLHSADILHRSNPAQSFCCAMAAVEVGLGGKGVALADKISTRMARLVVPDLNLRHRAIEVCKALYDIRSRVAHGDGYQVSERQAVFMRYVASCAIYSLCGYLRAAPRFGLPANVDGVRKLLDKEVFVAGTPIGTTIHPYLLGLLERQSELDSWTTQA
jgi:hypothetical protein